MGPWPGGRESGSRALACFAAFGSVSVPPRSLKNDLLVELGHVVAKRFEQPPPRRGDSEGLARPRMLGSGSPREPTALLHAGDRRVEGPWAQSMAVVRELLDQPCAPDLALVGVMKDVDL